MTIKHKITGSVVTFKNDHQMLRSAFESFLNTTMDVKLYVIDNSPTDIIRELCCDSRIEYIFNNKNIGFGAGHNIIMNSASKIGEYHLVLNPDIYFEGGVIEDITSYMEANTDTGLVMPKILYPDGSLQYLCKMLPTPFDFFGRRFLKGLHYTKKRNERFELRFTGYNKIMNVPYLSGCFMFIRSSVLKTVGIFDERIFMYVEDTDLSRRINEKFKTIFYPHCEVYHHFNKGSHKSLKLLLYSIHGAFIYFNKNGWFFDKKRSQINKQLINKLTNS